MLDKPGMLTDMPLTQEDYDSYTRHGYRWLSFQAQNAEATYYYDLTSAKASGLDCGIWGVTYEQQHFFRDGKLLGEMASTMMADHVIVDAEFCLINTRPGLAQPIINGLRAGGWLGPVHLTTLGAPDNPKTSANLSGNDFAMDVESFLNTGGGVIPQAFYNMHYGYRPKACKDYWSSFTDRINLHVSIAYSEPYAPRPNVRMAGAEWVPLLQEAASGKAMSVFQSRHILPGDLDGLDALTRLTEPVPEPVPARPTVASTWEIVNTALDNMIQEFRRQGLDEAAIERTRVRMNRELTPKSQSWWISNIKPLL
jgi:hypothetical protein